MKKSIYALILTTLFSVALVAAPQTQEQSAPRAQSNGPAAKLREDLATAVRNAKLNDDQKKMLEDAGSRLREARESRQNGGKVDRGSVRKAIDEIRKVNNSGAFRPEDEAAVKADLDALESGHQGRRPRLFGRR